MRAILNKKRSCIKYLYRESRLQDKAGNTALMYALWRRDYKTVNALVTGFSY